MHITKRGPFYLISHITGPEHNALFVSFVEDGDTEILPPAIEALPPMGNDKHGPLNSEAIRREVLAGIAEGNLQYGTQLRVKRMQYVGNDTPREDIYRYMAFKVAEYLAHNSMP